MQQELLSVLRGLTCKEDQCVVDVTEIAAAELRTAFEVCIHCRRTLDVHEPWMIQADRRYPGHTTYRAVFEQMASVREIAAVISATLETPLVQIQSLR